MVRLRLGVSVLFVASSFAASVAASEVAKPKVLSPSDEKRWIDAVENHSTVDGATVLQVLQYVEKLRPRKFKIGSIDVGYGGGTGEPEGVGIGYWIGEKRLPGDSFIDLWYDIKVVGNTLRVTPQENKDTSDTIVNALESGRTELVLYIDKMYAEECIDPDTRSTIC